MKIDIHSAPDNAALSAPFIITYPAGISAQQRRRRRTGSGECSAGRSLLGVIGAALAFAMLLLFPARTAHAAPENDDIEFATVVPQLPFTDAINTSDATTGADDPVCVGNGPTVWYSFTPTSDTEVFVEANTFGSQYDTTVSVYTGDVGNLTQIGCNDDTAGLQSRVVFSATAGTTYFIMVGSFGSGPGGDLVFTMDFAPPPLDVEVTIDRRASFDPAAGTAVVSGTVTCSRPVFVDVFGEVRQRVAGHLEVVAFFSTGVFCEGETSWSATADPFEGFFKGGQALLIASAFASDLGEFDQDVEQRNIMLTGR